MKKLLALLLALVMVFALAACQDTSNDDPTDPPESTETPTESVENPTDPTETEEPKVEHGPLEDYAYGTDYIALYEHIGDQVTIDDVYDVDGLAHVTVDGVEYELGMDFLSMAMVYKCEVPEGSSYTSNEEIYNEWWRLYIQRWNYMLPEIPLYSNQYYHVYNSKINGYEVTPYWSAARAMIYCTIAEGEENKVILGSNTDLTGSFRAPSLGKTSPNASDNDVGFMVNGLDTVVTTPEGVYVWDTTSVVKSHEEVWNDDGSKTYTIEIYDDMLFSDGSPVTAANYLGYLMVFSTPVGTEGAERNHMAGLNYVGYDNFAAYDGTNDGVAILDEEGNETGVTASRVFTGVRLLGDYTFSVTVDASMLPYYYDIAYGGFGATHQSVWLGEYEVKDDGQGCYLPDEFYTKDGESYAHAAHIKEAKFDTTAPFSGPYVVTEWNETELSASMAINPYYKGDYTGAKPSIENVSYIKTVTETQNEWLTAGQLDVLADITGADATEAALQIAAENGDKFKSTYYDRAGYGKLSFRCDFGPAADANVRRAVTYTLDRPAFAQAFTGGYGILVHGPYFAGGVTYKAVEDTILLDQYAVSEAAAIACLEEGGWIYNADGTEYSGTGIRYKKLAKSEQSEANLGYASIDGTYKTVEVNGEYYMPLVINWFCTSDNEFSEQLKTAWDGNEITTNIGMDVQWTQADFNSMLGELYQLPAYGYAGTPLYSAFNFATGYNAAVYDYSYNWTVDPGMFDDYSINYLKDEADIFWLD